MHINKLSSEILEKILIEGNIFIVSKVCQRWRYLVKSNKFKFDNIFFDLYKDDPEKMKRKPNSVYLFNSKLFNENGFPVGISYNFFDREYNFMSLELNKYLIKKFKNFFNYISNLDILNIVFDGLVYIYRTNKKFLRYFLSKKTIKNNTDQKIIGTIDYFLFFLFINHLNVIKHKIKFVNFYIKNIYNRLENIDPNVFFENEIEMLSKLIRCQIFVNFEKFTFFAPNNTYLIYNRDKKLLVVRYGNYKKYNLSLELIDYTFLDPNNESRFLCKNYFINCFKRDAIKDIACDYYPAMILFDFFWFEYLFANGQIDKLIIINFNFYDFIFDQLLEISKRQKEKKIEYHCLDQSQKIIDQENFKFISVAKENRRDYYFKRSREKWCEDVVI